MPALGYESGTGGELTVPRPAVSIDIYRNCPQVWNEAGMHRLCSTAALNITVSACSCTHGLEKSKDIKAPLLEKQQCPFTPAPQEPTSTLLGAGDHCHRTVLLSICLWGKAKTKDTSSPRPLVMGMTSLADGELQ